MSEITVVLKTEDARYTKKFLLYKTYTMDAQDPTIREIVEETRKSLNIEPDSIEDIKVRASIVIK